MNSTKVLLFCALVLTPALRAADPAAAQKKPVETFTGPAAAGQDFKDQGEYKNDWVGSQVIALANGAFPMVTYRGGLPGDGCPRQQRRLFAGPL